VDPGRVAGYPPTMEQTIDGRVRSAVDAWLRWLPRWEVGDGRGRTKLCRTCFGSPVAKAAGFDADVPHAVQHALLQRLKRIVDDEVAHYTERNLPLLRKELGAIDRRKAARPYRPTEGLPPEYEGLELDPDPEPGSPFLFTIAELAAQEPAEPQPELPPLSEAAKEALRSEVALADGCATSTGFAICAALEPHREQLAQAIRRHVEPQVQALLDELTRELFA